MGASLDGVSLEFVDSVDKAGEFLRWLGERREHDLVAVDLETGEYPGRPREDALSPWHGRVRLAQVGDMHTAWAIPWEDWRGVFLQGMNRWEGRVAFHNVAFEAKWLALHSPWTVPWHVADDTMLMAKVVDPINSAALKRLSSQLLDPRAAALQDLLDTEMAKNGWTWGTIPVTHVNYWAYGAMDCVLTARLWDHFLPDCGVAGQYRRAYELEMGARKVCSAMELNGAPVDLDYSQRKYDELSSYASSVKDWCKRHYRTHITSNIQLVRLFERLGAEITETTPTGQLSCTKDELRRLSRDGNAEITQLANAALSQRKASKLADTYFLGFLNRHIDGILHADIQTMGARTGRMSIQGTALQTLKKDDPTVRAAFIPRHEDHAILTSDLEQVEFRMVANFSGDPGLIRLFQNADAGGHDVFTAMMQEMYGDPTATKADKRRKLIKGYVYSRLYGAGVAKQAITAGIPVEQMRSIADSFSTNYPEVSNFTQMIEDIAMRRLRSEGTAYVTSPLTRRRFIGDERKVYALVNYLVQGTAAEVLKINLLKLDNEGLTNYLIAPVHDEVVASVPRADYDEIAQIVRRCMTTELEEWPVNLLADCSPPYENWGEACR